MHETSWCSSVAVSWYNHVFPYTKSKFKKGDKVGVVDISCFGHLDVKLAVSIGREVYSFM
jgi:D-arabinose 1-dehydrogenase-like Zn-dependent alcohol dehydrogenase